MTKTFKMCYKNICHIDIEAETEEEAIEKFCKDPSSFEVGDIEAYQNPEVWRVDE